MILNEFGAHFLAVLMGFFAIMNPIANTAIFVGLTADKSRSAQLAIAFRALLTSFVIVLVFSLAGKTIFHLFDITLPALRITGGILLFVIGYQMMHGSSSDLHASSPEPADDSLDVDVAYSPLAIPILAGPGTIATAMNYSAEGDWFSIAITVSTFALLCLITLFCFIFGQGMVKALGTGGLAVITRLMGLIIAVIGVQMTMSGVGTSGLLGAVDDGALSYEDRAGVSAPDARLVCQEWPPNRQIQYEVIPFRAA